MKRIFLFFILFYIALTSFAYADVPVTTGIIPGQIWYSKEPLIEGDTVNVYTAIWNGDDNSLTARVTFYDKNVVLGTRDVVIPASQMKDVNVSWQVTAGDHVISAKIISSSVDTSGKDEQVVLDRSSTSEDHKFVAVTLKNSDGTTATSEDIVSSQIDSVSSTVSGVLPASIKTPVSNGLSVIDTFRDSTLTQIDAAKKDTQKQIQTLGVDNTVKSSVVKNTSSKAKPITTEEIKNTKPLSQIDKPIAYVKLFFLSVLSFIFGNKIKIGLFF